MCGVRKILINIKDLVSGQGIFIPLPPICYKRRWRSVRKFIDNINKYLQYASIISMAAMLLVIFSQVIFRYVLHHSLTFSEELARYLFVYTVFFGIAVVARQNGHIVMEVLTQKLKGRVAKYTKIIVYICTLSFVIILFYNGIRMMILTSYQLSPALRISMSYVYFAIPAASFVMFCNILILISDTLHSDI